MAKITLNPKFNAIDLNGDIAIIQLSNVVTFNNYVEPVCLWKSDNIKLSEVIGREGTVVGFEKNGNDTTLKMQGVSMSVIDSIDCIESNRWLYGSYISKRNFCAGSRNGSLD